MRNLLKKNNEPFKNGDKTVNGKFKEGNPGGPGRPRGSAYIEDLRQAIEEVEAEKKKSLWKRLVERAFIKDSVLIAIVKKFIPDLKSLEIKDGGQDQLKVIIMERGYSKKEEAFIDSKIKEWRKQTGYKFEFKEDPDNKLTEEEKLILEKEREKKAISN
jgi:hypothetical protein